MLFKKPDARAEHQAMVAEARVRATERAELWAAERARRLQIQVEALAEMAERFLHATPIVIPETAPPSFRPDLNPGDLPTFLGTLDTSKMFPKSLDENRDGDVRTYKIDAADVPGFLGAA